MGRLTVAYTQNDDGSASVTDYDQANRAAWSFVTFGYDRRIGKAT